MTYDQAKRDFVKLLDKASLHKRSDEVFLDFLKVVSISFQNATETRPSVIAEREEEYLAICNRYDREVFELFPEMMALISLALEDKFGDFLGEVYMASQMGNNKVGQFFTPYSVSSASARLLFNRGEVDKAIDEQGYIRFNEPASGSGGMIIAYIEAMREAGYNPQTRLYVDAQDIDQRCALMCYVALCILHIPARVYIGDTLMQEYHEVLETPSLCCQWLRFRNAGSIVKIKNKM